MTCAKSLRGPSSRAPLIGNGVEAILDFVKWTQGQQPLAPALNRLADLLGAEAVSLCRRDAKKSRARIVLTIDRTADPRKPRLDTSFSKDILGADIDKVKAGAAVLLSDVDSAQDPVLERWMDKRDIKDIAIFCLGNQGGTRDILEFHFRNRMPNSWVRDADQISRALADVFAGRRPGIVENYLVKKSHKGTHAHWEDENALILSPENIAKLTRSEWRLCILIANGLSRDGAATEMQVTDNTIRTHLRNVYAKTGCKNFHDLARRLVRIEEQRTLQALDLGHAA